MTPIQRNHETHPKQNRPALAFHFVCLCFGLGLGWAFALTLRPQPISDFAYYWNVSTDPGRYIKGGVLLPLLAAFKQLHTSPLVAAATIDSLAWIALSWALWNPRRDAPSQYIASLSLLGFAIWFAGLFGIVNSDLPHVGLMALGFKLATQQDKTGRRLLPILAIASLGLGLSMRMQSLPALTIAIGLLILFFVIAGRRIAWKPIVATALAGTLALAIELTMRLRSEVPDEVRLHTRVTLYTGLLGASPDDWCGSWSLAAVAMTQADLGQPFFAAALRRLRTIAPSVPRLLSCKFARYTSFSRVGSEWLSESTEPSRRSAHGTALRWLTNCEDFAGGILKIAIVVLGVSGLFTMSRRREAAIGHLLAPVAIAIGYILVHLALEIQPRYILEPIVFAAVCAFDGLGAFPSSWEGEGEEKQSGEP